MNDGFLVRVLHPLAGTNKQFEPLANLEFLPIAILRDGHAGNVFHGEVRLTVRRGAGVEDLGDGRMIHDGERLALGLKTSQSGFVVHAALDELERYHAADRDGLFGKPDLTHAAFAELLDQVVGSERFRYGRDLRVRL